MELLSSSFFRGFSLGFLLLGLMTVLELLSWDDAQKLRKANPLLYNSAVIINIRNNLFLAPIVYYVIIEYCVIKDQATSLIGRLITISIMTAVQGMLYTGVHWCFHSVKGLYWMHKYHHEFRDIVTPLSANAVSVYEYLFAYLFPFMVAGSLGDEISFVVAIALIATSNLLIHTPAWTRVNLPWFLVSAEDHSNHHQKSNVSFAAPIIHYDRLFDRLVSVALKRE